MLNFARWFKQFLMNFSRYINYLLILVGGIIAIYAQAQVEQNQYILIGGILMLMVGIYRLSKHIPSKSEKEIEKEQKNKNLNE